MIVHFTLKTYTSGFTHYNVNQLTWQNPLYSGCPVNFSFAGGNGDFGFDINEAEDIAEDEIDYGNFDEITQQIKRLELLRELEAHPEIRDSNLALQTFYLQNLATPNQSLVTIDRLFEMLTDSLIYSDSVQYNSVLGQIDSINNNIVSSNLVVINEKLANAYLLKWYRNQFDALYATSELDSIETLATQCPFIAGRGVYKARSIVGTYNPNMTYDDKVICNSSGVNKNYHEEYEVIDPKLLGLIGNEVIKVFPNPAGTQITVDYSLASDEEGQFRIYDIMGRLRLKYSFSNSGNRMLVDVSALEEGIYLYKYAINGVDKFSNKIQIEK